MLILVDAWSAGILSARCTPVSNSLDSPLSLLEEILHHQQPLQCIQLEGALLGQGGMASQAFWVLLMLLA